MHFAFQAREMLEQKACSHLQSALEQRMMWNLTCYFSIPSYTWHFIYFLSPASNWPMQYYLQLQLLGIKVNSFVLCSQVQSPIQLRCSQQGKVSLMRTFSFLSSERVNGSNICPHPHIGKFIETKISLKAAWSRESVTLEANRYNDQLASWPFLLSGSASACSIAACRESWAAAKVCVSFFRLLSQATHQNWQSWTQAALPGKASLWTLDHDPAAAAMWLLLTCAWSSPHL